MIELLESHGIEVRSLIKYERGELVPSGVLQAAERRTTQQDRLWMTPQVGTPYQARRLKRCVRDLKTLSESVVPSRAIRFVRNGIASLEYGIQPKKIIRKDRNARLALTPLVEIVQGVIDNPNVTDDDFPSFIGQIVEDILVFDAGCWEYVEKPRFIIGNPFLGIEPVPGFSMAQKVAWSGDPKEPRWAQVSEDGRVGVELFDKDIEYLSMRKRSWTPFGLSPLETVVDIMDSWLNLASYQRRTASDSYSSLLLSLGEQISDDQMVIMRSWWDNQVKGQGSPGLFGGFKDAKILDLKQGGDERLYLNYQEMLIRTVAYSFGLKPLDVGIERDVNRCYDEQTEVLTSLGWKTQETLIDDDLLASVNPNTRYIEYQKPARIYRSFYDGEMIQIKSQLTDLLVTPNHRMWIGNYHSGYAETAVAVNARGGNGFSAHYQPMQIVHAEDVAGRFYEWKSVDGYDSNIEVFKGTVSIPRIPYGERMTGKRKFTPGYTRGDGTVVSGYESEAVGRTGWNEDGFNFDVPVDTMLEFLGYFVAEGGLLTKNQRRQWLFSMSQNEGPIADKIDSVLRQLPARVSKRFVDKVGCVRWNVTGKSLYHYLISEVGSKAHNKRVPPWVKQLSKDKLEIFFMAVMAGDGSWDPRRKDVGYYATSSKALADDVQEIGLKLGYRASVLVHRKKKKEHHHELYRVLLAKRPNSVVTQKQVTRVPYKGIVWCAELPPNGLFITRRNGKISIQGNSTAEVQRVQSLAEGIKSIAQFIASKINQRVLPRLAKILNKPDILKLEFFWMNLNPADDAVQATMYDTYIKDGVMFQDEVRAELDLEPRSDGLGMMDFNQQQQLYSLDPTGNAGKGTVPEPDDTQTKLAIQDVKKTTVAAASRAEEAMKKVASEIDQLKSSQSQILAKVKQRTPQPAPTKVLNFIGSDSSEEMQKRLEELESREEPEPIRVAMRVERNELGHLTAKIEYDQDTGEELKRWKIICNEEGKILEVIEE